MTAEDIIAQLQAEADPKVVAGMYRVGINPRGTLSIPIPELQKLARSIGKDHALALELWASGIHEARILAAMVDDVAKLTDDQMDRWAEAFNSWDVCDQVCKYLLARSPLAAEKARDWAGHSGQFVKRAAFAIMADLAVNDTKAPDSLFLEFLELAEREADDDRNYVKKATSWAVRQIGKRNAVLNAAALAAATRMKDKGGAAAKWVAQDVVRELESPRVRARFAGRRPPEVGTPRAKAAKGATVESQPAKAGAEAAGSVEPGSKSGGTQGRRRAGRSRGKGSAEEGTRTSKPTPAGESAPAEEPSTPDAPAAGQATTAAEADV